MKSRRLSSISTENMCSQLSSVPKAASQKRVRTQSTMNCTSEPDIMEATRRTLPCRSIRVRKDVCNCLIAKLSSLSCMRRQTYSSGASSFGASKRGDWECPAVCGCSCRGRANRG
eukprot:4136923-Lingulodinium_polyedra.AAC.1